LIAVWPPCRAPHGLRPPSDPERFSPQEPIGHRLPGIPRRRCPIRHLRAGCGGARGDGKAVYGLDHRGLMLPPQTNKVLNQVPTA
jgi:hypothetical protein